MNIALYQSAAPAVMLGFGLWFYCGWKQGRAAAVGLMVLLFDFAANITVIAALSRNRSLVEAVLVTNAIVFTPCILIGLAFFDRPFRKITPGFRYSFYLSLPILYCFGWPQKVSWLAMCSIC
jgi:hypothetical protein